MANYNISIEQDYHKRLDVVISASSICGDEITSQYIKDVIKEEYEKGTFRKTGAAPVSLVQYVCKKYGWSYKPFEFDETIKLERS